MPLTMTEDAAKEKFKPMWARMDTNGDGFLDVQEIMKACKINEGQAKALLEHLDTNKDGKVSFDEYMNHLLKSVASDEELDIILAGLSCLVRFSVDRVSAFLPESHRPSGYTQTSTPLLILK